MGYKRTGNYRPFPTSVAAGLACVATTLFALGLIIAGARHTPSSTALVGSLFFSSGLVQIITGIWAIVDNNLFGSVFLLCYGAFFMSLGAILAPFFDIASAYSDGGLSDALSEPFNSYGPLPEAKIFRMPASWSVPDDEK